MLSLAAELGERVSREIPKDTARAVGRLYEITLGRRRLGRDGNWFFAILADHARRTRGTANCHLLVCTNEFIYVD